MSSLILEAQKQLEEKAELEGLTIWEALQKYKATPETAHEFKDRLERMNKECEAQRREDRKCRKWWNEANWI